MPEEKGSRFFKVQEMELPNSVGRDKNVFGVKTAVFQTGRVEMSDYPRNSKQDSAPRQCSIGWQ